MENYLPVIQIPAIPIIRFLQGEEKSVSSNGTDAQHQFLMQPQENRLIFKQMELSQQLP